MFELQITSGRFWAAVGAFREVMTSGPETVEILGKNLVNLRESISYPMTQDGIELLRQCALVQVENDLVVAGSRSKSVWSDSGVNERQVIAQRLLFQLLSGPRRDLSVIAFLDREGVRDQHPEVFELLRDTGLLSAHDLGYEDFWSKLRGLGTFSPSVEGQDKRIQRGSYAEELSLAFEFNRLTNGGFPDLAKRVSRVSTNTLLGFDILSFTGSEDSPSDVLEIEVKNLSVDSSGRSYFHVSRNEIRRAETGQNQFVFHLWDTLGDQPVCNVVESHRVIQHLPREHSDKATWESCVVIWS